MAQRLTGAQWTLILICLLICPLLVLSVVPPPAHRVPAQVIIPSSTSGDFDVKLDPYCRVHSSQNLAKAHLRLSYSSPSSARQDEVLLEDLEDSRCNHVLESTHALTISGYGGLANWTSVASVIPLFSHLEQLHWENTDPIPSNVLAAVTEAHPGHQLYYDLPLYKWDAYARRSSEERAERWQHRKEMVREITNSRNMYSLKASIEYAGSDAESMPLIHEIVPSLPNLRQLDLSLEYAGGCEPGWPHIYAFDFTNRRFGNAAFPSLEVLKLNGYDFDLPIEGINEPRSGSFGDSRYHLSWPWSQLLPNWLAKSVQPCDHPFFEWMCEYVRPPWHPIMCPTNFSHLSNIDGWLERMNFSHLHTLELQQPSSATLHKISPVLLNLASLTINGGDLCTAEAISTLLAHSAKPLASVKLHDIRFPSLEPLMHDLKTHHNTTITAFSLHEHDELREDSCYNYGPEESGEFDARRKGEETIKAMRKENSVGNKGSVASICGERPH